MGKKCLGDEDLEFVIPGPAGWGLDTAAGGLLDHRMSIFLCPRRSKAPLNNGVKVPLMRGNKNRVDRIMPLASEVMNRPR